MASLANLLATLALMNGMVAIPNIVGLLVLSPVVKAETERSFKKA